MKRKIGLGAKKDLNAELNLTPFIDLLSTCVCFLLITAVWIEIGAVEIKQSHGTEAASSPSKVYDLDVVFLGEKRIGLTLKHGGKKKADWTLRGESFETLLTDFRATLNSKVLNFKGHPINIQSTLVTPSSKVSYGQIVQALDVLRGESLINIGFVSTGAL